jgi:hypothetical protein
VNPTFKDIVDLVSALAWPATVLILAFAFRRELKAVFRAVLDRATKLSGLGVTVELAASQVQTERLSEGSPPEEKAKALRDLEVAKAIAPKFDYWMKNYNHPPGKSNRDELLDWLSADRGSRYVSRDYGIFKALAEVLAKMGYDTIPAPTEGEFSVALTEVDEREEEYRRSR